MKSAIFCLANLLAEKLFLFINRLCFDYIRVDFIFVFCSVISCFWNLIVITMKYVLLVLFLALFYSNADSLDLKDIGKSAVDVAKGVVDKIPDVIPKPEDIFQGGKNLIAGYPFEQIFSAINSFCKLSSIFLRPARKSIES